MESQGKPRQRRGKAEDALTFTESARREQITGLAIELIAEHGYPGTSLARIAAAAGISNAAVLYHFGSKNAVLESAYHTVIQGVTEVVSAAMASAPTAAESIDAYVRSIVTYMVDHPTHMRLIVEVLMTSDLGQTGTPPPVGAHPTPRWAPLADAMARAQNDGALGPFDTRTAAIALGGAIDAIFAEALSDPAYDLTRAVDELLNLFHRATTPSTTPVVNER